MYIFNSGHSPRQNRLQCRASLCQNRRGVAATAKGEGLIKPDDVLSNMSIALLFQ